MTNTWHKLYKYSVKSAFYISVLGPDYMSQAGLVSQAGVSLTGSRHVC